MSVSFSINEVRKKLHKTKSAFENFHAVPTIKKIVINTCCSKFFNDVKKMQQIKQQLRLITGQQPVDTLAKKSVASFKLREGMHIGYKVTLRRQMAEAFLFKLLYVNFPRVQDFRGISSKAFDGAGNYTIGIKDVGAFIESDHDLETKFGLNITIVTNAASNEDGLDLLKALNFPFKELIKVN